MMVFDYCGVLGDWPTDDDRGDGATGRPARPGLLGRLLAAPPTVRCRAIGEREYWLFSTDIGVAKPARAAYLALAEQVRLPRMTSCSSTTASATVSTA